MNPDSYVTPQRAKNDTVTTPKGTLEDIATHLTPFWKSSDAFWTSEGVRKTELLSYAYPETQRWNFKTPDEYCKNVRATVKELYGPSSLSWILEQSTPGNLSSRAKLIVPSNAQHDITDLVTNGKYLEWIVNLKVEKHCLDGPFNVPVFLGDFERDDPSKWDSTANIVGSFSVLGDPADTGCGKCQSDRENHSVITGQVPLTLALAERYLGGELTNLESENVIEYLKKHLHWRVIFVRIFPSFAVSKFLFNHSSSMGRNSPISSSHMYSSLKSLLNSFRIFSSSLSHHSSLTLATHRATAMKFLAVKFPRSQSLLSAMKSLCPGPQKNCHGSPRKSPFGRKPRLHSII